MTLTKRAQEVVILDLRRLSPVADFFVVCSADSDIQVKAIANAVEEGLERKGVALWHREAGSLNWFVLDYVDVVLHVFHKNTRTYYNLEKLWGDARIKRMSDDKRAVALRATRRSRTTVARAPVRRKVS